MSKNKKTRVGNVYNSNSRRIFENAELCAQFLRDFSDIPFLKNVKPEDITDETKTYQAYLGIEFETDTVKCININDGSGVPVYIIALLEHKSDVDYDVPIQLLRYITCIWDDYAKRDGVRSKTKDYKYPLIIPIVYYEGAKNWTADTQLRNRIFMGDMFPEYIPDFRYKLVHNKKYSNDELLANNDEISFFMMLNKIQSAQDLHAFLANDYRDRLNSILENASEQTIKILMDVMWSLCTKLNVPQDEATGYVKSIGGQNMGYLFENMEKLDIQAERRNTDRERKRADAEKNRADAAEKELALLKKQLEQLKNNSCIN